MLQVPVLRNNVQAAKDKLAKRNFAQLDLIDEVVALDDERKKFN